LYNGIADTLVSVPARRRAERLPKQERHEIELIGILRSIPIFTSDGVHSPLLMSWVRLPNRSLPRSTIWSRARRVRRASTNSRS
jgi:hypothetical protein